MPDERRYDLLEDQPPVEEQPGLVDEKPRRGCASELWEWLRVIITAVVLAFLVTQFLLQRNVVVGSSMMDTLLEGDQLWVEKVSRRFGGLDYGDIITFAANGLDNGIMDDDDLVKRIIGLPGDTIEIREGLVWRNGVMLDEPYLRAGTFTDERDPQYSSYTVPAANYYVLGDNRVVSKDSRSFGPVNEDDIIGEVWIRIYPFDRIGRPK